MMFAVNAKTPIIIYTYMTFLTKTNSKYIIDLEFRSVVLTFTRLSMYVHLIKSALSVCEVEDVLHSQYIERIRLNIFAVIYELFTMKYLPNNSLD